MFKKILLISTALLLSAGVYAEEKTVEDDYNDWKANIQEDCSKNIRTGSICDIGNLVEICFKDNFEYLEDTIIVDFEGTYVEYTKSEFNTITHAYCMSIHKAQGNEFPIVIMAILNDYYIL